MGSSMFERLTNVVTLREDSSNRQYGYNGKAWEMLLKLLGKVQPIIFDEKVELVYPKKILSDEDKKQDGTNLEVVLFAKDGKIAVAKVVNGRHNFQVDLHKKENIDSILVTGNLGRSAYDSEYKAVIKFKDGNELILNNKEDTNQHRQEDYSELIVSIVRLLL